MWRSLPDDDGERRHVPRMSGRISAGTLPIWPHASTRPPVFSPATASTASSSNLTITATDANGLRRIRRPLVLGIGCPAITISPAIAAGDRHRRQRLFAAPSVPAAGAAAPAYLGPDQRHAATGALAPGTGGLISGTPTPQPPSGVNGASFVIHATGCDRVSAQSIAWL